MAFLSRCFPGSEACCLPIPVSMSLPIRVWLPKGWPVGDGGLGFGSTAQPLSARRWAWAVAGLTTARVWGGLFPLFCLLWGAVGARGTSSSGSAQRVHALLLRGPRSPGVRVPSGSIATFRCHCREHPQRQGPLRLPLMSPRLFASLLRRSPSLTTSSLRSLIITFQLLCQAGGFGGRKAGFHLLPSPLVASLYADPLSGLCLPCPRLERPCEAALPATLPQSRLRL